MRWTDARRSSRRSAATPPRRRWWIAIWTTSPAALPTSSTSFFPEVIALSGGVANQGDALLVPLRERVRALSYGSRYAVRHTRIELCTLGYRAGVIGAALLAKQS